MPLNFDILHRDSSSSARAGRITTPHGSFDTPAFMPVGTQGTVKGLLPEQVAATGAQVILANTYHLMLRPGSRLVADMGGLHAWCGWPGPILTDSGGFQVFSLADTGRIDDEGVRFRSHLDGATVELGPRRSMEVQNELGADIIMALDDCPPAPRATEHQLQRGALHGGAPKPAMSDAEYARRLDEAGERTLLWLDRCVKAHARREDQALFGIVQGGVDLERRAWCAARVTGYDLPGYAIGGVSVGEGPALIAQVVAHTAPLLPEDRPRYLMGVGTERDILAGVAAGVDMFDCVLPTRNGRNGCAFTRTGPIRLKNARFRDDPLPIDQACDCVACRGPGAEGPGGQGWESCATTPLRRNVEEMGPGSPGPCEHLAPRPLGPSAPRSPRCSDPTLHGSSRHFSRSYIRHLLMSDEMLGGILVSHHNLRHLQRLLLDIRRGIAHNDLSLVADRWPAAAGSADSS